MRIVVILSAMLIVGAIRPGIMAWEYHPPALFIICWAIGLGIATALDVLDCVARLQSMKPKERK